jgi:hypothetical protein
MTRNELIETSGFFITHNGYIETTNSMGACDREVNNLINLVVLECAKIAWNNEPDGEICNLITNHFGIEKID